MFPPRPSSNIGAIIGGVVAGVIVVILGRDTLLHARLVPQKTKPGNLAEGQTFHVVRGRCPVTATSRCSAFFHRRDNKGSAFATLRSTSYESSQAGEHSKPQQPASGHTTNYTSSVMGSNPSGESLIGTNLGATIHPRSLAVTNPGSLPSVPEAYRPPNVNEKLQARIPRHSAQGATISAVPPSGFYTSSVANLIHAQIPDEPVEEGLMSRQASMRTTLPPYSPGGFQHDEDAPPLPTR